MSHTPTIVDHARVTIMTFYLPSIPASLQTLGRLLVWNSPRREGMLPAGDERGNWNVTWFPADVWPARHVFPEAEETGARRVPRAEEARVGVGKKEVP